jgi:putative ABC transport system ATP-binding protein
VTPGSRPRPSLKLDTVTGQQILRLLRRIADQDGTTALIVTHDMAVDAFADEVYHLQDGRITSA